MKRENDSVNNGDAFSAEKSSNPKDALAGALQHYLESLQGFSEEAQSHQIDALVQILHGFASINEKSPHVNHDRGLLHAHITGVENNLE